MRAFKTDTAPKPGWSVDWKIEDKYDYIADDRDVRIKYTDLTQDAEASICEAWVDTGIYGEASQWVPRVMVRRKTEIAPLDSTFVSVIEPCETASKIASIRRIELGHDAAIGIEVARADGKSDLVILNRLGATAPVTVPARELSTDAELACLTFGPEGVEAVRAANAGNVTIGQLNLKPTAIIVQSTGHGSVKANNPAHPLVPLRPFASTPFRTQQFHPTSANTPRSVVTRRRSSPKCSNRTSSRRASSNARRARPIRQRRPRRMRRVRLRRGLRLRRRH